MRFAGMLLFFLAAVATLPTLAQDPPGNDPKVGAPQEIHLPLKGTPEDTKLVKWFGPVAEKHVRFEPAGLRFNMPENHPTFLGVSVPVVIKGDFELTIGFEVLREPEPEDAGPKGTKFAITVILDNGHKGRLARRVDANGGRGFSTWTVMGKKKQPYGARPTTAMAGRLRLVRTGAALSYFVSEAQGAPFALLESRPLGAEDVKEIQLTGDTSGPTAFLDARFTDLRIRAGDLPAAADLPEVGAVAAGPAAPRRGGRLLLAGILLVGFLLLTGGAWLFARQRRRSGAT